MEKNERLAVSEIIEDLTEVLHTITGETWKYYFGDNYNSTDFENTMDNIDGTVTTLRKSIDRLAELSNKQGVDKDVNSKESEVEKYGT